MLDIWHVRRITGRSAKPEGNPTKCVIAGMNWKIQAIARLLGFEAYGSSEEVGAARKRLAASFGARGSHLPLSTPIALREAEQGDF